MEHEHAASLTARVVKKALPDRAILTKDARQMLNSATSVFTLYLASLAHEASVANKRSTITLKDVLQTLRDADFEHFVEPIEECLQEAKTAANKKKDQKIMAEEEDVGETTNEVAAQLDEVALDTNEEDVDEDMTSDVDKNSSDAEEDQKEKEGAGDVIQDNAKAGKRKTANEEDDSVEAMEQS